MFSLLALSGPLGLLLGGLLVGALISWQGYNVMFLVLAILWSTLPFTFYATLREVTPGVEDQPVISDSTQARGTGHERWFPLLLVVALLSAATISVSEMGVSLSMQTLAFSPSAVSSTSTAAGLVMIPVVLLMSLLSDRLGRRNLLILGYLLTAIGAAMLVSAQDLWHFWGAMALVRMGQAVNDSLAPAVATDLLPADMLSRRLPRLKAMNWAAGIFSFTSAGYAMDAMGIGPVLLIAGSSAVVAACLLTLLPAHRPASILPKRITATHRSAA
jgi:MFS family permease